MKQFRIWCLGLCAVVLSLMCGCARESRLDPKISQAFYAYRYDEALDRLAPSLEKVDDRDRNLNRLRYASAAICAGKYDLAKDILITATQELESFEPDGEFKAQIEREDTKDFLGDPYEQMMAFFYLALLDYRDGDYDKALAGLKTALLADAGSREERYQADSALVLFMAGKAHQQLREPKRAQEYFQETKDIALFKDIYDIAHEILVKAIQQDNNASNDKHRNIKNWAAEIYFRELSYAAQHTLDVTHTLQQGADTAASTIGYYTDNPSQSSDKSFWNKIKKHREDVIREILTFEESSLEVLKSYDIPSRLGESKAFAESIDIMSRPDNNVTIILELGKGPYKYRAGEHGHLLKYGHRSNPEYQARIQIKDQTWLGVQMEDLYYQASTRGGREMDAFLKGKAVFKDVTKIGGAAALFTALELSKHERSEKAAAVAAAAAVVMLIASETTQPEADIRHWEFLPNDIQIVSGKLKPGTYNLQIDFLNDEGKILSEFKQVWQSIEIKSDQENLFIIRSGANKPAN